MDANAKQTAGMQSPVADIEDGSTARYAKQPVNPRAFCQDALGKAKLCQYGEPGRLDHQARAERMRSLEALEQCHPVAIAGEQQG